MQACVPTSGCSGTLSGDVSGTLESCVQSGSDVSTGNYFKLTVSATAAGARLSVEDDHYPTGMGVHSVLTAPDGGAYKNFAAAGLPNTLDSSSVGPACCASGDLHTSSGCRFSGRLTSRLFPWTPDGGPSGSLLLDGGYVDLEFSL